LLVETQLKGAVQATLPQGFATIDMKKGSRMIRFTFALSFALFVHTELAVDSPPSPHGVAKRKLLTLSALVREYNSWLVSEEGSKSYECVLSLAPSAQARALKERARTAVEKAPGSRNGTDTTEGGSMTLVAPHPDPEDSLKIPHSLALFLNGVLGMQTRDIRAKPPGAKKIAFYMYPLYKKNSAERPEELWWEGL
jgi:hypothetical protein